ncbi:MAG: hypothetical protein IMF07_04795 [Proteobacteria bacterium]|nr:hypothetical protein [Pseudomonadota bacterium]
MQKNVKYRDLSKLKRYAKSLTFAVFLFVTALPACAPKVDMRTLNSQVQSAVKEGEFLIEEGKMEEGVKMIQMAQQFHPDDPRINTILEKVPSETLKGLSEDSMLGFNKKGLRAPHKASVLEKVLWYIPDRIKDAVDMFTVEVNVGPQLGAGAWVTRAAQVVAYTGSSAGLGYYQKGGPGGRAESSFDIAVGPVGGTAVAGAKGGLFGPGGVTASAVALHKPSNKLYQDYRDYWGIGGKVGLFVVGVEAEYHPLEIVDFLAGIFLIDWLNDDMATTRRLKYNRVQKDLLKSFGQSLRGMKKEDIEEYKSKYPVAIPEA